MVGKREAEGDEPLATVRVVVCCETRKYSTG